VCNQPSTEHPGLEITPCCSQEHVTMHMQGAPCRLPKLKQIVRLLLCVLWWYRGGNSGSPIWVVWPSKQQQQQQGNQSGTPPADWDRFQAVGVHSSSLKFLKDSQVDVYADELYAQAIARAQQRQAAAAAGQQSAVCSANTSSFRSMAPTAAAAANSAAYAPSRSQGSKSVGPQASGSPGSNAGPEATQQSLVVTPVVPESGAGPAVSRDDPLSAVTSTKSSG
jgi:hypothetical protein